MRSSRRGFRIWRLGAGLVIGALTMVAASSATASKVVFLEEGKLPSYRWGMLVHRDHGRGGNRRPCIVLIVRFRSGWGPTESDDTNCGPLPRRGPPVIMTDSFGSGEKAVAIFALAFDRRVASVQMDLGEAGAKTVRLKLMNGRQAQNAGVSPLRFRTFAIRGEYCLGTVHGYDSGGHEIYSAPPETCDDGQLARNEV